MLNSLFSNEMLFILQTAVSFLGVILAFRFFGKTGLFAWCAFITVFANLEVANQANMFGMAVSLGNVAFVSLALAQDILSENYGQDVSKNAVYIGFTAAIMVVLISQFSIRFTPNEFDTVHEPFKAVFTPFLPVVISSLISYLCSNRLNVWLYAFIRNYTDKLWLRSQFSTWISQLFDSFFFTGLCTIAGVFEPSQYIILSITTYIIKIIVAVFEIPCLYWAKNMFIGNKVREIA